jgi:hypothetical protein
MTTWVKIKYVSQDTGKEVGHKTTAERMQEVAHRYHIAPETVTYIEVDGEEYPATAQNFRTIIGEAR